jgi:hypothetical protein
MDQGPLVTEQIDAGAKLLQEFDSGYAPLSSAFWLKESEDGQWYLYLVSPQINDSNFDLAYGEVHRLAGRSPSVWLDPFQVKVAGVDDPVAKAVGAIQSQYPSRLATRLRNRQLGDISVDEVYIYALPVTTP